MPLSRKNVNNPTPVPPMDRGQAEELYQQIMPELGLEAKDESSRRTYHTFSVVRYRTPKVVKVLIVVLVLIMTLMMLIFPSPVTRISVNYADASEVLVNFNNGPLGFFNRVTALLNGIPVDLIHGDDKSYSVSLKKNGELSLISESPVGISDTQTVTIQGLDDVAPQVVRHLRDGDDIHIYFTDDDSGVDWDALSVTGADGEPADFEVYPDEGYVSVRFPEDALTLHVPDKAGNALSVVVNLAG